MNIPPNSPINRIPSRFDIEEGPNIVINRPLSNTESVPANLRGWYSNKIYKVVIFSLLCFSVLGISTALTFTDRMSIENFLGVLSSLLFLNTPSPLENLLKSKKK